MYTISTENARNRHLAIIQHGGHYGSGDNLIIFYNCHRSKSKTGLHTKPYTYG